MIYKKAIILIFVLMSSFVFADEVTIRKIKELPPVLTQLENELIFEVNKLEELLYKRGKLYEDQETVNYLNAIEKKIASNFELEKNIKLNIKIVRDPVVNAFALPNGSIYIHTGALARLENEAQLTFLLSHETSHVVNRDTVYNAQSWHNKTVLYKLVDIALAPTSIFFGVLGDLTQMGFYLLHASTITGYGRRIEARADRDGIRWAIDAGYDPQQAASVNEVFLSEKDKYQKGQEIFYLMSHPITEWRLKKMKKLISEEYGEDKVGNIESEKFLETMAKIKLYNATLNIKIDRLEHANDNIKWILEKYPDNPEAHYLMGEIYRLKAEDKKKLKYELSYKAWKETKKGYKKGELEEIWINDASVCYNRAIECNPNYPNSYKGLALLYKHKGDNDKALTNLRQYLELNPDAEDKRYILFLIERLNKNQ